MVVEESIHIPSLWLCSTDTIINEVDVEETIDIPIAVLLMTLQFIIVVVFVAYKIIPSNLLFVAIVLLIL